LILSPFFSAIFSHAFFFFFLQICVHCLFNGMSLGADISPASKFWTFFAATVGHKVVDGFATGVPVYRAQMPFKVSLGVLCVVAISAPLGIILGYFVASSNDAHLLRGIIMALSGGSFIFVACFELIPAGLGKGNSWLLSKIFAMLVGFGIVAVVAKWA
jgi:zinc transporter 1/2/3